MAKDYDLTGSGYFWEHKSMNPDKAFSTIQNIIKESNTTYIPQHSGEIWEVGYFRSLGITPEKTHQLYSQFTQLMKDEFSGTPDKNKKRVFNELTKLF